MVEGSSTQPDGQEVSDEMGEATSAESDVQIENLDRSKGSSEIVETASTQPDNEETSERVKASSSQPDNKESNEIVKVDSTKLDSQGISEIISEIVKLASTQSDGKKRGEIVGAASSQPDGEKSNEMVKTASTQSDVQIIIQKRRKRLAKCLDKRKETMKKQVSENKVDLARYRLLVGAIYEKKVRVVEDLINKNLEALLVPARIEEYGSTIFHLIVLVPGMDELIKKLVSKASSESLELGDINDFTALHSAAMIGNTKAVKLFVETNRKLLYLKDEFNLLPVDHAIESGRYKETVEYLLSAHAAGEKRFDEEFPKNSALVLHRLIESDHIDLALGFLNQYPKLADQKLADGRRSGLWDMTINKLARKDMGFPCGTWQRLIYYHIPVKIEKPNLISEYEDIENQIQTSQKTKFFAKLQYKLWNALLPLVPGIKCIHDQKLLHEQTLEMVRLMIAGVTWSFEEALESLKKPMLTAAILGNYRFVEEILRAYTYSFTFYDEDGHTVYDLAVLYRQENVFNLIHSLSSFIKDTSWIMKCDIENCNILHLAGRLVPSNKVPGAALQMQRELQWFKAVEYICHPKLKAARNLYNKTPKEVFTEEHKILVKEGEKWMKETATACSVVAALIITVVFATAYTFPGGINGEGLPNLLPKTSFKVFLISIALALFSSTTSVQMFLGILTSRYAEEDFLESLPKKLIAGLITLFFSIASMMVAFASTFHIFLQPWKWLTFVMAALVFVPVTLFAFMQFPLLVDIFKSTYRPSILRPMR